MTNIFPKNVHIVSPFNMEDSAGNGRWSARKYAKIYDSIEEVNVQCQFIEKHVTLFFTLFSALL